jgi:hypothetical protein
MTGTMSSQDRSRTEQAPGLGNVMFLRQRVSLKDSLARLAFWAPCFSMGSGRETLESLFSFDMAWYGLQVSFVSGTRK